MLGRNHVATGLAVGLVSMPWLGVQDDPTKAVWVLGVAGAALLPDLDTTQSKVARIWGPPTRAAAWGIGKAAGGHRKGTHDALLAPLGFGLLVWVSSAVPLLALVVLALLVGLVLQDVARLRIIGWPVNLAASFLASSWLLQQHTVDFSVLAPAVAVGSLVHIAGDALTNSGVPTPLLWLRHRAATVGLRLFTTGGAFERFILGPALFLLTLWLLSWRLESGGIPLEWQR